MKVDKTEAISLGCLLITLVLANRFLNQELSSFGLV
jgi:hypothetical protein